MQPKIILDPRKEITTGVNKGRFHCKIKASIPVYVDGKKKWVARRAKTQVFATPKEFKMMMGDRPGSLQGQRDILDNLYAKAKTICKIPGLTPDQYIRYMEGKGNFESVTGMFDYYIGVCSEEDEETGEARDGNALALTGAKNFFCRYKGSNHISYAEITKEWLESCKKWALSEIKDENGKVVKKAVSPATFYLYCRELRTVMNLAVDPFKKITKDEIPFGEGKSKFKIPGSSKKKRKIKLDISTEQLIIEKNKILSFKAPNEPQFYSMDKYLNYWKASYFGNGSNMADVLRWKIKNIETVNGNKGILFKRKKTENTEEEEEPIFVLIGPELQEIINKEGNKSLDPEEYIFPVLNKKMNSAERNTAIREFCRMMNRSLKRAAKRMGLQIKLSSGSARYLMSTLLDRSGIPNTAIKQILGHNSLAMQDHYVSPYLMDLMKNINTILSEQKAG